VQSQFHDQQSRAGVMLRRLLIALSSLAMLFLAPAASAADLIGQTSIIDGDTIENHGQTRKANPT
jgi:hypothetical protein